MMNCWINLVVFSLSLYLFIRLHRVKANEGEHAGGRTLVRKSDFNCFVRVCGEREEALVSWHGFDLDVCVWWTDSTILKRTPHTRRTEQENDRIIMSLLNVTGNFVKLNACTHATGLYFHCLYFTFFAIAHCPLLWNLFCYLSKCNNNAHYILTHAKNLKKTKTTKKKHPTETKSTIYTAFSILNYVQFFISLYLSAYPLIFGRRYGFQLSEPFMFKVCVVSIVWIFQLNIHTLIDILISDKHYFSLFFFLAFSFFSYCSNRSRELQCFKIEHTKNNTITTTTAIYTYKLIYTNT